LDHSSLNEVFITPVKQEIDDGEKLVKKSLILEDLQAERTSHSIEINKSYVKNENDDTKIDIAEGKAWQKLMNLLMQLRKVCDQYFSCFMQF
jgi:hypothetical protein